MAGAKVEYGGAYSGWQPNIDSPVLKVMKETYKGLFKKEPSVKVMHAGLECGIIQGAYPKMDMVSVGPDLEHPHSPDERVKISSVQKLWDFITATLQRI